MRAPISNNSARVPGIVITHASLGVPAFSLLPLQSTVMNFTCPCRTGRPTRLAPSAALFGSAKSGKSRGPAAPAPPPQWPAIASTILGVFVASGVSGAMLRADFRSEIQDLKADSLRSSAGLRADFKADIQSLKADSLRSSAGLRADFKADLQSFKEELTDFKADVREQVQGLAVKIDTLSNDLKVSQATQNQLVGKVSVLEKVVIQPAKACNT